ncbi:MAG TPA: hypothetical protein PLL35_04300, partial [Candidatus Cloacimonas sp.]|nr:hypothetical protein [Candidatus Cloacimonas sp.]
MTSFSTHLSRFISLIRMVDLPVNPPLTIYFFTNMHAVTKNPGCRTPIRQMPSGILYFKGLRHYWQIGICQPIIG